jgi:hypothetical protein
MLCSMKDFWLTVANAHINIYKEILPSNMQSLLVINEFLFQFFICVVSLQIETSCIAFVD